MDMKRFKEAVAAVADFEFTRATEEINGIIVCVENDRNILRVKLSGEGVDWAYPEWEISRVGAGDAVQALIERALAGEFRIEATPEQLANREKRGRTLC